MIKSIKKDVFGMLIYMFFKIKIKYTVYFFLLSFHTFPFINLLFIIIHLSFAPFFESQTFCSILARMCRSTPSLSTHLNGPLLGGRGGRHKGVGTLSRRNSLLYRRKEKGPPALPKTPWYKRNKLSLPPAPLLIFHEEVKRPHLIYRDESMPEYCACEMGGLNRPKYMVM